jgi:hypothetical protein
MRRKLVLGAAALCGLAATSAYAAITIGPSVKPFVDISGTGTNLGTISDDSEINITGAALTAAGFTGNGLLAGGADVRVGNNGAVIWSPAGTQEIGYINAAPPTGLPVMAPANTADKGNGNGTNQFLAVLWDDNFPTTAAGTNIKWQVNGGDLIVQWTNEDHFNATGAGLITYEMIVHSGVTIASGGSLVDYVYQDTQYAPQQYQNDGGSATIGYKNWGVNPDANDVEYGQGGGNNTISDPPFGDPTMMPKVAGYVAADNPALPHSVTISGSGVVPEPASLGLLGAAALGVLARRRRA